MSTVRPQEEQPEQGRATRNDESLGFWASLSPADQKKYTLVFLVSLGTTLLVTGRSGGSLLKRAKKSEAHAPATPSTRDVPRPPPPPPLPPRVTLSDLAPLSPALLPTSFLNPNAIAPPRSKRRKLLPSFTSSSSRGSILGLAPRTASSYFLPNSLIVSRSTAFAKQVDLDDKLHEDGRTPEEDEKDPIVDDGFNPAVYAAKALGIATAITFTTFGVGIWGIMQWLGVKDMDELSLALTHGLGDKLKLHRPNLPQWALPSPPPPAPRAATEMIEAGAAAAAPRTTSEREGDGDDEDEEATTYWTEVRETLDREADEKKRERRDRWNRFVEARSSTK